jgi:hypothetical protein
MLFLTQSRMHATCSRRYMLAHSPRRHAKEAQCDGSDAMRFSKTCRLLQPLHTKQF